MSPTIANITYNPESRKFENITVEDVKYWESVYPDVDVIDIILKKAPAWLFSNPERAHKKKWSRFLNNWLAKQQLGYDQFKRGQP